MPIDGCRRRRRGLAAPVIVLIAVMAAACTGEDATPVVPGAPTGATTPHQLEPTDQMRELAEQQCLDDPDLEVGEINAVDPNDTDQVLATVAIDCATVRGETD